jgi:hypothetical protein
VCRTLGADARDSRNAEDPRTFNAPEDHIAELRVLMDGRDPREVLELIPPGIIRDTCDIIINELGQEAQVRFVEDQS